MPEINSFSEKEHLEKCLPVLQKTAIESTSTIFQSEFSVGKPWNIVDRIPGCFEHNFSMGSGNEWFQSIMTVGLSSNNLELLIKRPDMFNPIDVFGELLNTFCGLLMDQKDFTNRFGVLIQSIPLYALNLVYYPKAWAGIGEVSSKQGATMQYGIALRLIPGSKPPSDRLNE